MSVQINQDKLFNIISDIVTEKADSCELRNLLFNCTDLTDNQPINSEFIIHLVDAILLSNNEELVEVLVEFLESESENDLEK